MNALKILAVLVLASSALTVQGQAYPSRPVKIVVPTSPGGATDALSRQIGGRLAELWDQPVVVENKPGTNQMIGSDYVAKSAPDGHALLVSDASSFVINPTSTRKCPTTDCARSRRSRC